MEKRYTVYRHRRLDTNKIFYIGIGNEKRPFDFNKRSDWWKKIYNKTQIEVEILAINLTVDEASDLEILLIQEYGRIQLGTGTLVNMTEGGDNSCRGAIRSEAHKEAIRVSNRNRTVSQETRDKMGLKSKGRKPSNKTLKILTENGKKSKGRITNKGILVLNNENGVFHHSIQDASKCYNIPYMTLKNWLTVRLDLNKTNLIIV